MSERIALSRLRLDGGTQPRVFMDELRANEYAEDMAGGASFPPVVVFHDGANYWLADGYHRLHAARKLGWEEIDADVRAGSQRDAILFSVGANATHGLYRTNQDKWHAIKTLIDDKEWGQWSDREIARQCKVGHPFVAKVREEVERINGNTGSHWNRIPVRKTERKYKTKHGTTAKMNTDNIGKSSKASTRSEEKLEDKSSSIRVRDTDSELDSTCESFTVSTPADEPETELPNLLNWDTLLDQARALVKATKAQDKSACQMALKSYLLEIGGLAVD